MNKVILIGRLARMIELRTTSTGRVVTNFSLALDRKTNGGKVTDFFECVAWGKTAELMKQYTNKGDKIGVEGTLTTREYEDKNGNKRKAVEILVDSVEFLSGRNTEQGGEAYEVTDAPQEAPQALPFEI